MTSIANLKTARSLSKAKLTRIEKHLIQSLTDNLSETTINARYSDYKLAWDAVQCNHDNYVSSLGDDFEAEEAWIDAACTKYFSTQATVDAYLDKVRQSRRIHDNFPLDSFPLDEFPLDSFPPDNFPHDSFSLDDFPLDNFPPDSFPKDSFPTRQFPTRHFPTRQFPTRHFPIATVSHYDNFPRRHFPTIGYFPLKISILNLLYQRKVFQLFVNYIIYSYYMIGNKV